jgi:hypothetical protein
LPKLLHQGLHTYLQPIRVTEHQVGEVPTSNLHPEQNRRLQHAQETCQAGVLQHKNTQWNTTVRGLKKMVVASQELPPMLGEAAFVWLLVAVFVVPQIMHFVHQNAALHRDSPKTEWYLLASWNGNAFFVLPSHNILQFNRIWYHRF